MTRKTGKSGNAQWGLAYKIPALIIYHQVIYHGAGIMRLFYNPKHLGDGEQAWKSFLTGSMVASSLIFLALTENVIVFVLALLLTASGAVLFIRTNMNFTKATYLSQNILSAGIGLAASLVFHAGGFLMLYLGVILVLVLVTWLHRFATKGKTEAKAGKTEAEGKSGEERDKGKQQE